MTQYGKSDYWNERYASETEPFDWYQRYGGLKHILAKHVKHADRILMVGAGNSRLSEEMYNDGYKTITNIDISNVVVDAMSQKYANLAGMVYKVLDVTNMGEFANASFDVVIDKGTLDALLCGDESTSNADKMLLEISRVLRPGGVFILITYGEPPTRLNYLERAKYGWKVESLSIEKPHPANAGEHHYVYIATRN